MSNSESNSDKAQKPGLALLRKPFPSEHISKLPKPTKAQTDAVKQDFKAGIRCEVCGGWHHPKVVHLDYVGHAALTDRLLDADPEWNWSPLAFDPDTGLPALDKDGGLWINLTVCGVTRHGYGDAGGKSGPDAMKERIGDALRNAAMRFGAALDLWHKGDLHPEEEPVKREQISPEPVNQAKVDNAVIFFKMKIDADLIEDTHEDIKSHFRTLTNDEKLAVADLLTDKAPDSNKMYKSLLKEHINYKPEGGRHG
jgi:hypothetical protein